MSNDRKQTMKFLEDMATNMAALADESKAMVKKLAEEEEAREKFRLNAIYGVSSPVICGPCWPVFTRRAPAEIPFTWAEIKEISRQGQNIVRQYFQLGDTKKVQLKNGEEITLRIIGFFHDRDARGNLIPITWETEFYLKNPKPMNDDWTNKGGWAATKMRDYLNREVLTLLPDDLRSIITPAVKETSCGDRSTELQETEDHLFLLSEWEKYGRKFYAACQEGRWYPFYAQEGVSYAKTYADGEKDWGWLRSPRGSNAAYFCFVDSSGVAAYGTVASYSDGVAFGLCT